MTLLAYCSGLIFVCTVLLVTATAFTIKNYWLLRELSATADEPPARHEAPRTRSTRYDSGPPAESTEGTGTVTPYAPKRDSS